MVTHLIAYSLGLLLAGTASDAGRPEGQVEKPAQKPVQEPVDEASRLPQRTGVFSEVEHDPQARLTIPERLRSQPPAAGSIVFYPASGATVRSTTDGQGGGMVV